MAAPCSSENAGDSFSISGKYYTTAELESLRTGDRDLIARTCGARHTEKSINGMMYRMEVPALTSDGVSGILRSLCMKLGIIPSRESDLTSGGKMMRIYRTEVMDFLLSLPGAASYDEEQWLDTPELWAFADFSGGKDRKLLEELERRSSTWCDGWVPLRTVLHSSLMDRPESVYMIPNRLALSRGSLTDRQKLFRLEHTYIPASYVRSRKNTKTTWAECLRSRKLLGKMSPGRVSYLRGIPVADLMDLSRGQRKK